MRLRRVVPCVLLVVVVAAACVPTGNPDGTVVVPFGATAVDTSHPTRVIGTGTKASCTSAEVVRVVALGGIITFNCGPDAITIAMDATARIFNNTGPEIVIDGGGKVTLDGKGQRRILYMNTCDQSLVWTTSHCQDQDHPRLTLQNLTFQNGYTAGQTVNGTEVNGGGAVYVHGGRVKVVKSRFFNNRCAPTGPDVGGGALRVSSQSQGLPVFINRSTFGGRDDLGNSCSNGGALSSIGVSWVILNSIISWNTASGDGANPAKPGTPGGGNGGGIALDGDLFTLRVAGTIIEDDHANEGGGAIFFVSNDGTGTMRIEDSTLRRNPSDGFETAGYKGIFFLGSGHPVVVSSTIE